jgi:hypothetical protein
METALAYREDIDVMGNDAPIAATARKIVVDLALKSSAWNCFGCAPAPLRVQRRVVSSE